MQCEPLKATPPDVLRLEHSTPGDWQRLLERYGLTLEQVPQGAAIPGSFWGDDEAGLCGNRLYARADTPIHSMLHEACHAICMSPERRARLHTNAGGDYDEENAVCYLQILLAPQVTPMTRGRMFIDMDRWGYSFRLGSAQAWFEHDADDARQWLIHHGLIDNQSVPTWALRQAD